jgi:hypothetical protein
MGAGGAIGGKTSSRHSAISVGAGGGDTTSPQPSHPTNVVGVKDGPTTPNVSS